MEDPQHETSSLQPLELGPSQEDQAQSLPRADGGLDAWLVLAGAFVLEALVWGFPFAFGVFQEYYLSHEHFSNEPSGIAAISTTASGIMFLAAPPVALLIQRFGKWRRQGGLVGLAIIVSALIAASFSNSVPALLATQGVMYALGGLVLYFPAMYVIDEWFIARRGLAFAIVWTGTSIAGAVVPFLCQWLLDAYGFRTALRVWSVVVAVLATPSVIVTKSRLPPSSSTTFRPNDLSSLTKAPFWFFEIGNIMASLAYFLPQLWIPSFAASIGLPSFSGPVALLVLNIDATIGYLGMGLLVDRFHVSVAILIATIGSVISILVFWGLARSQAMLYVFSFLWGVFGGGYAATWSGCANAIRQHSGAIDTGLVIAFMCVGKGIGSLITGPISEQLLQIPRFDASFAYGTQYGSMIVFAGVSALLGGTACVGRVMKVL